LRKREATLNYKIGEIFSDKGVCRLGTIENVPEWAELHHGFPHSGPFPDDAQFRMSPDFPKDIKLADTLVNTERFFVVSERFLKFLEEANALVQNDVFEVGILNHKGRREKAKYYIVHQLNHPHCVDEKNSVGEKSPIDPTQYLAVQKLTLDPNMIDKKLLIFRPAEYRHRPFVREDLASKIAAEGFTGIEFFDVATYNRF
jgi:hypothetical protein